MNKVVDVCLLGGGVVGHSMALALSAQRKRTVWVKNPPASAPLENATASSDVRAYALNQASREWLLSQQAWPESGVTPVKHMQVWGDDSGSILFSAPADEVLTWMVDAPALEACLYARTQNGPSLQTSEHPVAAKLTIICDGRLGQTAHQLGVTRRRLPYGQTALATRVRAQYEHCGQASQWFGQKDTTSSDILALLPLDGEQGRELAVVWSLPHAQAQRLTSLSDAAFETEISLASQHALGPLQLSAPRRTWPLEWGQASAWCGSLSAGSAWVLAGDAARNIHPLAGLGMNLGLGDVRVLMHHMPSLMSDNHWRDLSDLRWLRAYERQRKAEVAATTWVVDGLQRLFDHPNPLAQKARNLGMSALNQWPSIKQWVMNQAVSPL